MNFKLILFVRVCMSLLSNSWYVPDETWQSVEVAHKSLYKRGYLTWEWRMGIHSTLPTNLYTVVLAILKACRLDFQYLVIISPKLLQAVYTAFCEFVFLKSYKRKPRNWLSILLIFNWHTLYTGSRTLINTVEYCLTCVALSQHQPWKTLFDRGVYSTWDPRLRGGGE